MKKEYFTIFIDKLRIKHTVYSLLAFKSFLSLYCNFFYLSSSDMSMSTDKQFIRYIKGYTYSSKPFFL